MSAVICYASVPGAGSSGLSGSFGNCDTRGVNRSTVQNLKFNDPANGTVEIRDGAFVSLANTLPKIEELPQIEEEVFSVCSKVGIVESYDGLRGTSKFRQFFTPVNPSMEGATLTAARHKSACVETAATQSCEIAVSAVANGTDAVVRNRTRIGEQGPEASDGCARDPLVDRARNSRALKGFSENHHVIAGNGSHRSSVCLQASSQSSLTSRGHGLSLAE